MIWIDSSSGGHWQAEDAPALRADDRGFAYGDGLFETVRVREGVPMFLLRHLVRLRGGLEQLAFPPLPWDEAHLVQRCRQVVVHNAIQDGVLKITVTRGPGRRGFEPPVEAQPMLVIQAIQTPKVSEAIGVSASLTPWKVDPASPLCYLKHLSALDKVLARQTARQARADEALFLNLNGLLTEGTSSNLFVVIGKQIFTPAVHCGLLPGITRGLLTETYSVVEAELSVAVWAQATEAFLTNATAGVRPLVRFNNQPIGSGEPGAVTAVVAEHYRKLELRELAEGRKSP